MFGTNCCYYQFVHRLWHWLGAHWVANLKPERVPASGCLQDSLTFSQCARMGAKLSVLSATVHLYFNMFAYVCFIGLVESAWRRRKPKLFQIGSHMETVNGRRKWKLFCFMCFCFQKMRWKEFNALTADRPFLKPRACCSHCDVSRWMWRTEHLGGHPSISLPT